MLGDFNDASITHKTVTTRFTMKDGKYFVETEGADGKPQTFEVRYTVGHRPLQQYLVETEKGRLQVLDLAWDVDRRSGSTSTPTGGPARRRPALDRKLQELAGALRHLPPDRLRQGL